MQGEMDGALSKRRIADAQAAAYLRGRAYFCPAGIKSLSRPAGHPMLLVAYIPSLQYSVLSELATLALAPIELALERFMEHPAQSTSARRGRAKDSLLMMIS
jgi:hypothetical protein